MNCTDRRSGEDYGPAGRRRFDHADLDVQQCQRAVDHDRGEGRAHGLAGSGLIGAAPAAPGPLWGMNVKLRDGRVDQDRRNLRLACRMIVADATKYSIAPIINGTLYVPVNS